MTKGDAIGDVEAAIGQISKMIFSEMQRRYPF
jgi:hypothetical protein